MNYQEKKFKRLKLLFLALLTDYGAYGTHGSTGGTLVLQSQLDNPASAAKPSNLPTGAQGRAPGAAPNNTSSFIGAPGAQQQSSIRTSVEQRKTPEAQQQSFIRTPGAANQSNLPTGAAKPSNLPTGAQGRAAGGDKRPQESLTRLREVGPNPILDVSVPSTQITNREQINSPISNPNNSLISNAEYVALVQKKAELDTKITEQKQIAIRQNVTKEAEDAATDCIVRLEKKLAEIQKQMEKYEKPIEREIQNKADTITVSEITEIKKKELLLKKNISNFEQELKTLTKALEQFKSNLSKTLAEEDKNRINEEITETQKLISINNTDLESERRALQDIQQKYEDQCKNFISEESIEGNYALPFGRKFVYPGSFQEEPKYSKIYPNLRLLNNFPDPGKFMESYIGKDVSKIVAIINHIEDKFVSVESVIRVQKVAKIAKLLVDMELKMFTSKINQEINKAKELDRLIKENNNYVKQLKELCEKANKHHKDITSTIGINFNYQSILSEIFKIYKSGSLNKQDRGDMLHTITDNLDNYLRGLKDHLDGIPKLNPYGKNFSEQELLTEVLKTNLHNEFTRKFVQNVKEYIETHDKIHRLLKLKKENDNEYIVKAGIEKEQENLNKEQSYVRADTQNLYVGSDHFPQNRREEEDGGGESCGGLKKGLETLGRGSRLLEVPSNVGLGSVYNRGNYSVGYKPLARGKRRYEEEEKSHSGSEIEIENQSKEEERRHENILEIVEQVLSSVHTIVSDLSEKCKGYNRNERTEQKQIKEQRIHKIQNDVRYIIGDNKVLEKYFQSCGLDYDKMKQDLEEHLTRFSNQKPGESIEGIAAEIRNSDLMIGAQQLSDFLEEISRGTEEIIYEVLEHNSKKADKEKSYTNKQTTKASDNEEEYEDDDFNKNIRVRGAYMQSRVGYREGLNHARTTTTTTTEGMSTGTKMALGAGALTAAAAVAVKVKMSEPKSESTEPQTTS